MRAVEAGPRLFVLGASGSGKTPLARQVAARLGVPHVMASGWVRRLFPDGADPTDRQARIEAMTRFSLGALRQDPLAAVSWLERHHPVERPCVIEGMRNPSDFVRVFDPRTDLVVFLEHRGSGLRPTGFEAGLEVIAAYLAWSASVGLLDPDAVLRRGFDDIRELDAAIDEVHAFAARRFPEDPAHPGLAARVHADVPPIETCVRRELLHGGRPAFAGWVPCTAFAFASYPGSAPTFTVRLADGAVFSYVPPHALRDPARAAEPELDLADLAYHNCPDGDVVVVEHAALRGELLCFFKRRDLWLGGRYRFTVDWYRGNDLLHCVDLDNGQIAFLPNHKIKFGPGREPGFAPYQKLRNDWRVG